VPRFFFEIVTSTDRIEDPDGFELPDLKAAEVEASEIAEPLRDEIDDPFAVIEIKDSTGTIVGSKPFNRSVNQVMTSRKGELTPKRKLRDWPHHVTIPIPEGVGLPNLQGMHVFVRDMDYQTVSINGQGAGDATLWCFRLKEDADAFRAKFG
jgi:hypothetical protein